MPFLRFPDPRLADEHGIVAVGGRLDPHTLREAYRRGVFPWPVEGYPMLWFCPEERAVLEFKDLHVSRSLARERRRTQFRFTIDRAFASVIKHCALAGRPGQDGTWITREVVEGFREFHRRGRAHSVEAWEGDELVGGIYGVDAEGAFCGESMFYLRPNASKLALLYLVEHLRARGLDWLDIQVMTPHMQALGARNIPRDDFLRKLADTQSRGLKLF
ncbi:MAG TPA: leucyl/phenylalanyl-tRNA--protein transferase [Pyrinomonadaceae bacterium]|nr:leucyl/phenylalanyl-tRNA--protein transferase [Pyrinomonadaceae bacterium]